MNGSPAASETATSTRPPSPGRGRAMLAWTRRWRTTVLITAALLVAVATVALTQDGPSNTVELDPANPGLDGAQALAEVLDRKGLDLEVVRSADGLRDAEAGTDATVVVTSTQNLGPSTAERLLADTSAATVVVVDAGPGTVDAFEGLDAPSRVSLGEGREAACDLASLDGLTLEVDRALAYPATLGCFPADGGSVLVRRAPLLFFGGGQALTNDQILRGDNAAIALRMLGQRQRLVWYVPDFADVIDDEGASLTTLIPRWVHPGLWLAALTSIALILWRGRRLGPLAIEPMPVTVKAIETTRSRGRLYRRAADRTHATHALRAAARRRATQRLRLASDTDEETLVRDLAHHLRRPESQVAALVGSTEPSPTTDRDLIRLANDLAEIEREVLHP